MNISRQTHNIVKNVLRKNPKPDWAITYVPHGINEEEFFPINALHSNHKEYSDFEDTFKKKHDVDFILFWNNRNIRRKSPGDLILSYKTFCDKLPKEKADRCILLMNTQIRDDNGTDLAAVKNALCPDYKIEITNGGVDIKTLNYFYNISDVVINIASNEGFGLSSAEALVTKTPIINNVTGGLQDQCRFHDEHGNWIDFTTDFPSNHDGTYQECGGWAKQVFPSNRSVQGSPLTPYIFDDRCDFRDVADAMLYWYEMSKEEREHRGELGYDWATGEESNMTAKNMCKLMIKSIEDCFEKWTPRKRFTLYKAEKKRKIEKPGVIV